MSDDEEKIISYAERMAPKSIPLVKPISNTRRIKGRMISANHSSKTWKGIGTITFLTDKDEIVTVLSADKKNPLIFDKFLIFDIDIAPPHENKFLCYRSVERIERKITPGIFAEMLLEYHPEVKTKQQSATVATNLFSLCGNDPSRIKDLDVVRDFINPETVFFYLKSYFALIELFPDKDSDIRKIHHFFLSKMFKQYQSDLESFCYQNNHGLGELQYDRFRYLMVKKRGIRPETIILELFSVWYFQRVLVNSLMETIDSQSSTRVMISENQAREIRESVIYDRLFKQRKVLFIYKMQHGPTYKDHESYYLLTKTAENTTLMIKSFLERIIHRKNEMPSNRMRHQQMTMFYKTSEYPHSERYEDQSDQDNPPWSCMQDPLPIENQKILTEEQATALRYACENPLVLVTGGPGTGKTSMVLCNLWKMRPEETIILTPSGTAGDRAMEEIIKNSKGYNQEPMVFTIDYVLEYLRHNPGFIFKYITCVLIDESSFVDEWKLARTLKALPYLQQLIMIGDVDQIAPIGKGYPFRDMLDSFDQFTIRLSINFRSENNVLRHNALCILENRIGDFRYETNLNSLSIYPTVMLKRSGLSLEATQKDIMYVISQIKRIEGSNFRWEDVQFITPYNKTRISVCKFIYEERFRQSNSFLSTFHKDQRIVFLKNYKEKKISPTEISSRVCNGELGTILAIYQSQGEQKTYYESSSQIPRNKLKTWIRFQNKSGKIKAVELSTIEYQVTDGSAITNHKGQGAEYRYVVKVLDPFSPAQRHIVNRNSTYTGFTRAKEATIILFCEQFHGSQSELGSFSYAVKTPRPFSDTFLWYHLREIK